MRKSSPPRLFARNYRLFIVCTVLIGLVSFVISASSSSGDNSSSPERASNTAQKGGPAAFINSVLNFPMPLPSLTVTMTDQIVGDAGEVGKAGVGETIRYTVTIQNGGPDPATNLILQDTIDANTTLVGGSIKISPLAANETYQSVGNMTLTSSAIGADCNANTLRSVTCNDTLRGGTLTGFGDSQANANATIPGSPVTVAGKGTMTLNADGTFVFNPVAGFEGAVDFWYTINNAAGSDNAKVTINVGVGNGMVWFIDNTPPSASTNVGTQANPFTSLASFVAINNGAGTGDTAADASNTIFVYESATPYAGPVTLLSSQKFIGQDTTVSLSTLGAPAAQPGNSYPAVNNPTADNVNIGSGANGILLNSNNVLSGFILGGGAAQNALQGTSFGTLSLSGVNISSSGQAISLTNGALQAPGGGTAAFGTISSGGGTNGILLSNVTGSMSATGGSLTGTASGPTFSVVGGSVSVTYSGGITQAAANAAVSVTGGHSSGTIIFQTGAISATAGTGLQFNNADGIYNFNGTTTLNGGDAGVDIQDDSAGTFTFASTTSITSPSGIAFNVNGNASTATASVTYNGNITQANNAAMVSITNHNTGVITFQSGTLNATNGTGLQFTNADSTNSYSFTGTTTLNGGDAGIDILAGGDAAAGSAGTFNFGATTSINRAINVSGEAFNLSGSDANVTYSGSITLSSGTGNMVAISDHDAGTMTFQTGNLTKGSSTTQGISISNSNGGTINFINPTITITTTTANAISLTSNAGAIISFNPAGGGNGVDITASSGTAFNATTSGTVTLAGSDNSITTTTGTAVNITDTTIGGSGMTLKDLNSATASSNVVVNLSNTGNGTFTVTGTGTTDGSGGTIDNKTTDAMRFSNTDGLVTLKNMVIEDIGDTAGGSNTISGHDAIHAEQIDGGMTLDNMTIRRISDNAINGSTLAGGAKTVFNGLTITNSVIQFTNRYNVSNVGDANNEGMIRILGIRGTVSITNNLMEDGGEHLDFFVNGTTANTLNLTATGNTFNRSYKEFTVGGLASVGGHCIDVTVQEAGSANITIGDLNGSRPVNSFLNCRLGSVRVVNDTGSTGSVTATVAKNNFTVNDHSSGIGGDFDFPMGGVLVWSLASGSTTTRISGNYFDETTRASGNLGSIGILADLGTVNGRIDNNTFDTLGDGTWTVRARNNATQKLKVDNNSYIRGFFTCPDAACGAGGGYFGPALYQLADAQSGGNMQLTIDNETYSQHDTAFYPGNTVEMRTDNVGAAPTMCVQLSNLKAPDGYALENNAGTFQLYRGASAFSGVCTTAQCRAVLQSNNVLGGGGINTTSPPTINHVGTVNVITSQCQQSSLAMLESNQQQRQYFAENQNPSQGFNAQSFFAILNEKNAYDTVSEILEQAPRPESRGITTETALASLSNLSENGSALTESIAVIFKQSSVGPRVSNTDTTLPAPLTDKPEIEKGAFVLAHGGNKSAAQGSRLSRFISAVVETISPSAHAAPAPMPALEVNESLGTLPANKSVTVVFDVTVNGPHPYASYTNNATVKSAELADIQKQTVTPGDRYNTTTALTASPTSPASQGQTVTFTATVTPSEAVGVINPATGGFVQFRDGGNPMGVPVPCTADGNNCKAELQTNTLPSGMHPITTEYVGTHHEPSASTPLNYTINACTNSPVVTTILDGTSPVPAGSLREAIASVCPNSPNNVITFATGAGQAFDPATGPHVIQLVAALPDITKSMTISGPGANQLTVQGSASNLTAFRVFNVKSTAANVNISKMTIGNSASMAFGGGINIESGATVLLSESAVSFNRADVGGGGGIYNAGTLTIVRSTISNNVATAVGGGGILNTGTLNVYNSTVSSNTANVAAQGGGVLNSGSGIATFINATVAANFSDLAGGGIASISSGATNLGNTIVAYSKTGANVAVADLSGVFTSQGNNWIQDASGTSLTSSGDPQIQPLLANNGGATLTHAPLKGSPVLDAGSNALIDSISELTDQRDTGFPRKMDSADVDAIQTVDIGAFELHPSVEDIADKTTPEDTPLDVIFNIGDATGPGSPLITSVTATSSNTGLAPDPVVSAVAGSDTQRKLTITPVSNANSTASGTATITVTVTATNGQTATDTFVLTVSSVNDVPVATNDPNYSTDEDTALTVNTASGVLANDTDSDSPSLTAVIVTNPSNAQSFTLNADGSFNYTPVSNFNGTDSFTYKANDGTNDSNVATVTITVNAVNDPVGTVASGAISVAEDSTNNAGANMSITDVDAAIAPNGVYEVSLSSTNGTMSLTTIAGLMFTAGDGTADATMTFHGTLASINTALATATYTPNANYSGSAQIKLDATDTFGGIVATGTGAATTDGNTINVTVTAVNDAPTLTNNGLTVNEGSTGNTIGSAALSLSDDDNPAATSLIFQLASVPAKGTLKKSGTALGINDTFTQDDITNSRITYDHDGSETTSDSFNFTATDGTDNIGSTAFNINVTPQNDAPTIGTNAGLTVVPGTTGTIDSGKLSVTDPDNAAIDLVYTVGTAPANGALKNNGTQLNAGDTFTQDDINNSLITYTHNGGVATTDSFTFTVSDGAGGSIGTTTFSININCTANPVVTTTANDGPGSLRDAVLTACAGSNITFNLDSNTDPGYDSVTDTFTIKLTTGELSINRNVTITGPVTKRLIVSGNNTDPNPANRSRVFSVAPGATVTIFDLTIANGESQLGGGIYNLGDLTLIGVTLTGNKAVTVLGFGGDGGAIDSDGGSLTIYNSTISGNTADGGGGGIHNCGNSTATLLNVTITGNRSDADDLSPGEGGGLEQVSTNSLTLNNTIVAGNLKGTAAPVANDIDVFGPGGIVLANSKNNLIGDAATSGGITNGGAAANIVGNAGAGTIDINTVLDTTLANNGGPTRTHKLVPDSQAVNNGSDAAVDAIFLITDQRGSTFNRKVGTVDIGAYEVQAGIANRLAFNVQPSNTNAGIEMSPPVTVRILDVLGNLLNSTANVTLAIGNNPGGGTLSGTTTVAAINGTATFNDLSINNLGVGYTLTASSTGLAGATSNAFNIISASIIGGAKSVSGTFSVGQTITYTIILGNFNSGAQLDNAGNEFTDVLPAGLTLVSASATSGTAVATLATNTVTWNGIIPGGGAVTVTINATINAGTSGQTITNQGSIAYDADGNGTNEAAGITDDPNVVGSNNPTSFIVNATPTITPVGITRNAGDAGSNVTIANVNDLEDAENTLAVTVDNGASAIVNGVTVSGLSVSAAGVVTANVVAACGATNASFTLKVADSGGLSSTGTLNVTVNANTAPALTYSTQAVDTGASLSINPATGPTDTNLNSITVLNTGTYTGGISVNNTTGVVSITNAAPLGSHTITIRATDSCGVNTDAQFTLNVNKINQTITFNPLANKTFGDADFNVSATASSNLAVSFSATGNCAVTGTSVHITGAGSCTVTASQAGNQTYNAATPVQQSFTINKANTTTTVTVADAIFDGQPHGGTANVTGAGGLNQSLTVTYTGRNATTYGPSTTAPTNAGEYTASASFAANADYNGSNDSKNFQIGKANQTITFNPLTDKTYGDAPFTVSATTTAAGLNVSFTASGPCQISGGNTVNLTGAGACTITASQAGNNNFNAAVNVQRTFNIAKQATTINVSSSANPSVPGQNVTFTATVVWSSGILTGTVQFKDGGVDLGAPVALSPSGAATFSTNALSGGNHNITAVYSGDANYQTSTGTLAGGQVVGITAGLSISDVTVTEGNSGTTNAAFTVTLSTASNLPVTVDFTTANGTATTADNDYQTATGTLTFQVGETTKTVTVLVNGDTKNESNETFFVNLTNAQNANIGDNQAQGTITNDDTPTVQLSSSTYTINEGANNTPQGFTSLAVDIVRSGDASAPATVKYITSDASGGNECNQVTGQASQRCDYILVGATLRFAAGETTKTIQVPIINDGYQEGAEFFNIELTNAVGVTLGTPSQAIITIQDDAADATPTTSANNPYLSNPFFVRQNYLDLLGRDADQNGFVDWTNVLNNCGPQQGFLGAPKTCDRAHVAHGFFGSVEFTNSGFLIHRLFEVGMGRLPLYREFIPDMATLSGFNLSQAQQQQNLEDYLQEFTSKPEFINRYQGYLLPSQAAQFIQLLEQVAGVTLPATATTGPGQPQQYGRQELINLRAAGTLNVGQTLKAFVEQKPVYDTYFERGEVTMLYFAYLRRDPNLNDPTLIGWNDWVNVFRNGNPGQGIAPRDIHHLIFGFIYSEEYRRRFGQP